MPDAATAVAVARRIGRAVALKLDADGLTHKTDVGGVVLGLHGDDAVYGAALALLETARRRGLTVRGLLVEPMVPPGVELIVGLRRDPQFGPAVLVGLGGVLTEVLDDVAIRLAPIDLAAATAMLDDLRGAPLLAASAAGPASIARRSRRCSWRSVGSASSGPTSSRSTSTRSSRRLGRDRGRCAGRPRGRGVMTDPMPSRSLLVEPTSWGVRLVLNRPAKLNAINPRAARRAERGDRGGRRRRRGPGHRHRRGRPGVLLRLRPVRSAARHAWGWREVLAEDVEATLAIWRCPSRSSPRSTATRWPAASSSRWPAT